MFIRPVGASSLLVVRFAQWFYTPRVLQWGLAQSLLAERLRRPTRAGACYYPPASDLGNDGPSQPAATRTAPSKPVDRFWPSDRQDEELKIVVERAEAQRIELRAGTILDLWM